ncbi:MAG TPA: hypothetical protein VLC09_03290, partial [Polyangiaceae bacterium]|nr:hypothetical protein [Polyangiaceae bacterium]
MTSLRRRPFRFGVSALALGCGVVGVLSWGVTGCGGSAPPPTPPGSEPSQAGAPGPDITSQLERAFARGEYDEVASESAGHVDGRVALWGVRALLERGRWDEARARVAPLLSDGSLLIRLEARL